MKFKHLLMSGLIMALAGFFVVGCNENPDDPNDPNPDEVAPPTGLMAVSMDGAVMLKWTASADADTYVVTWDDGTTELSTEDITYTEYKVEGLTNGTVYTFSVVAVDAAAEESDAATISWAAALRYTNDRDKGGILRIYARSVPSPDKGTGIVIQQTGAFNASVGPTSAFLSQIQLIADVQSNFVRIGAPKSFTEFGQVAQFRNDVQISDNYVELSPTVGLDGWYNSASLEGLFTTNNTSNFNIQDQLSAGAGAAFAMRWGTAGSYRYARVFVVPGANGKLVQTDNEGDPFVEIRISYQSAQGVPYAK